MPTTMNESVQDDALALDADSGGCGCGRRAQINAEGVARRCVEAHRASGLVSRAIAKRDPGGVGTSSSATVVDESNFENGSSVSAFQLYETAS